MRATRPMAIATRPGVIELQERPMPEIGEGEVLIRVKTASICGSDLHIFKGMHPAAALPVSVGHEICGEIEQIGSGVASLEPGERVTVEPIIACGQCHFCLRGQYHLCTNVSFQYRQGQGGFTSHFVVHERWVHRLPDAISDAEGALLEPASVAMHAVRKSGLGLGDTSLIFGAGAIGLLILQLSQLAGASQTMIVDVQEFRLQTALKLGATDALHNLHQDVQAIVEARTHGLGVDKSFEAVGLQVTLVQALKALRKGGTAVLVGLFEKPELSIPANIFVQREIALLGSQGYCWDFEPAIELAASGKLNLKGLITQEFPLDRVQDAFDLLMSPGNEAIKVVLRVDA